MWDIGSRMFWHVRATSPLMFVFGGRRQGLWPGTVVQYRGVEGRGWGAPDKWAAPFPLNRTLRAQQGGAPVRLTGGGGGAGTGANRPTTIRSVVASSPPGRNSCGRVPHDGFRRNGHAPDASSAVSPGSRTGSRPSRGSAPRAWSSAALRQPRLATLRAASCELRAAPRPGACTS
eukprot:gene25845-biopygen1490